MGNKSLNRQQTERIWDRIGDLRDFDKSKWFLDQELTQKWIEMYSRPPMPLELNFYGDYSQAGIFWMLNIEEIHPVFFFRAMIEKYKLTEPYEVNNGHKIVKNRKGKEKRIKRTKFLEPVLSEEKIGQIEMILERQTYRPLARQAAKKTGLRFSKPCGYGNFYAVINGHKTMEWADNLVRKSDIDWGEVFRSDGFREGIFLADWWCLSNNSYLANRLGGFYETNYKTNHEGRMNVGYNRMKNASIFEWAAAAQRRVLMRHVQLLEYGYDYATRVVFRGDVGVVVADEFWRRWEKRRQKARYFMRKAGFSV